MSTVISIFRAKSCINVLLPVPLVFVLTLPSFDLVFTLAFLDLIASFLVPKLEEDEDDRIIKEIGKKLGIKPGDKGTKGGTDGHYFFVN